MPFRRRNMRVSVGTGVVRTGRYVAVIDRNTTGETTGPRLGSQSDHETSHDLAFGCLPVLRTSSPVGVDRRRRLLIAVFVSFANNDPRPVAPAPGWSWLQ